MLGYIPAAHVCCKVITGYDIHGNACLILLSPQHNPKSRTNILSVPCDSRITSAAYDFTMGSNTHFTVPTTNYWQEILENTKEINAIAETQPWRYGYPARLPDSRILMLPIRPLNPTNPNEKVPTEAVASLLVNQASIDVVQQLGEFLANAIKRYNPDVIVGLPTLGLTLAPIVAQRLGHSKMTFPSHSFLCFIEA
jgi:hypothetical protein